MRAIVFVLIFAIAFAATREGSILCNLCKDTVNLIENLLTVDGAQAVRQYIDNLCAKADGFLGTLCNKILSFGVDELVKLIENHVDPVVICEKIHAC
uniref:Pore-forming protein isoform B n=1 Tax=Entamoeba dispar TaxID=46681 RepID=Q9U8G5_ENTDI|nr:pore-forming protein isoform B precursor [Entamoeba dispar]